LLLAALNPTTAAGKGVSSTAEAMIRLNSAVEAGKPIFNVEAWLRRTGFFYILELSRDNQKYSLVDTCVLESTLSAEDNKQLVLEQEESITEVHQALQELNTKDRQLLQMRFFEELSWEEIQARFALNGESVQLVTLRKRGERAIKALREAYLHKINT
jgi:RNA polymerase sigma factor (sigma-70 family)